MAAGGRVVLEDSSEEVAFVGGPEQSEKTPSGKEGMKEGLVLREPM